MFSILNAICYVFHYLCKLTISSCKMKESLSKFIGVQRALLSVIKPVS